MAASLQEIVDDGINIELPASAIDMVALGIAKVDRSGQLTYANAEVLRISGLDDWRGHGVAEIFEGDDLQTVLHGLQSRFDSRVGGGYEVGLTRADGRVVPVSITALPETNADGDVIGTLAIVRDLTMPAAQQRIYRALQEECTSKAMLEAIAAVVRELVPFDQLSIYRMNKERTHLRNIFAIVPAGEPEQSFRWWPIPASIKPIVDGTRMQVYDDIEQWYQDPARRALLKEPAIRQFIESGYVSCLSYPMVRNRKPMASIGLYRKGFRPFTKAEQQIIDELPLTDAVSMALRSESENNLTFLIELMRHISSAYGSVAEVAQTIVEKIAEHYEWDDVSIFQVYEHRKEITLIAQWAPNAAQKIGCTVGIGDGILGQVFETKQAVLRGDLDGGSSDGGGKSSRIRSQLCLPIGTRGLWLLNVKDEHRDAFASEEKRDLETIANELSALLDRTLEYRYRSAIFNRANDAIFLTSQGGMVIEVNEATTALLGLPAAALVDRPLADLLKDPSLAEAILANPTLANQEVVFRRGPGSDAITSDTSSEHVKVLLSAATLPDDIDGRVFIATDMSLADRLQQLKLAKQLYKDLTGQIKTPMSLATAWLRRFATRKSENLDDFATKILQQLHKVELTLDRMMLYEQNTHDLQRAHAHIELCSLVESVLTEMPSNERSLVAADLGPGGACVTADAYQLRYCLQTILSYLIRLVPEDESVKLRVAHHPGSVEIVLSGKGDEDGVDGDVGAAARHGQVAAEMSLGTDTLRSLIRANGGDLMSPDGTGDRSRLTFRMRFPMAPDQRMSS